MSNPFSDEEHEKQMLCALLVDPARFIPKALGEGLSSEHFFNPDRAWLFRTLVDLHEREDYETINGPDETGIHLLAHVKKLGGSERMPVGTLNELRNFVHVPHDGHFRASWEALVEAKARRTGRNELQSIEKALCDGATDPNEILAQAQDLADKLASELSCRTTGKVWEDYWPEVVEHLTTLRKGKAPGLLTNIHPIDATTAGMSPGELWVIGGRTSGGKSVLLLQMAWEAIRAGEKVLVFTMEMSAAEVILRLMSGMFDADYSAITKGHALTDNVIRSAQEAGAALKKSNLIIDDSESVTADKIQADCDKHQPRIVIVDYMQLMDGERRRNERQDEEIGRNAKRLKQIAKRVGATVLTASQLNDEGRLFASRAIGHHADNLFTIRDDGVKVDKNRNGQRNQLIPLKLSGETQRFQHECG